MPACLHVCHVCVQVIRDLSGPPNYWDLDRIENNMFRRYKREDLDGALYDSDSIMHYRLAGLVCTMYIHVHVCMLGVRVSVHEYILVCIHACIHVHVHVCV